MCTVSWLHQAGGYHLLVNRDERRTRGIASGPALFIQDGIEYLAPVDPEFGGSWLAVNQFGVSVCLLNRNGAGAASGGKFLSRGLLIRDLASDRSARECFLKLQTLDLSRFAAFELVILQPGRSTILTQWDGRHLTVDLAGDSHMPLTSSSYDEAGVRRARLNDFARRVGPGGAIDPALLYAFHSSHNLSPDAYSTCMHREDAETVSFSWVIVTPETVRFLYSPTAPCRHDSSEQQILPRAA